MWCNIYLKDVLCLFQIWIAGSVRETESACRNREMKKWGRERGGVEGLSQLLFCWVSSDSGLGCTPSSLGKRFKTQLPSTPFYEKTRWKYAKQHSFWISSNIFSYRFFSQICMHNLVFFILYFKYLRHAAYYCGYTLDVH